MKSGRTLVLSRVSRQRAHVRSEHTSASERPQDCQLLLFALEAGVFPLDLVDLVACQQHTFVYLKQEYALFNIHLLPAF